MIFLLDLFLEANLFSIVLNISFYIENNITPVIETDFTSSEKLDIVKSLFKN